MEYASFLSNIAVGDKVQVIAEDGGRFSHYTTSSEGEKAVKKVTRDFIFIGGSKFSRKDGIIKGQFLREVSIWPSEEYRTKHLEMLSSMQSKMTPYGVRLPRITTKDDAKQLYALLRKIHRGE